jgi:Family of unknown function (DUF6069)
MNQKVNSSSLIQYAPLAGISAAVINVILYYIGVSVGWIDTTVLVAGANQPVTVVAVIISSILPTILAAVVLAIMNRFLSNSWGIFKVLAIVLLVLSFVNPFLGIPTAPLMMAIWLNVMHVTVAGAVLYFFGKAVI